MKDKIACILIGSVLTLSSLTAKDIRIGVSTALTGASGEIGRSLLKGSQIVFDEYNRKKSDKNSKLEVIVYDDQYDPEKTLKNTIKLIQKDNVDLLFGYVGTPTVIKILPLLKQYEKKKVNLFFPYTGAEPHRQKPYDEYVFNLRASYANETKAIVDNLMKIGRKKIAVFYQNDAYGRGGWAGVKYAIESHGKAIVAEATYRRGKTINDSYQKQADLLMTGNPDAVIMIGSYEASAGVTKVLRKEYAKDILLANISFVGGDQYLSLLKKEKTVGITDNLIISQVLPSIMNTGLKAVKRYRNLYKKHYPNEAFDTVSFEGYINAKVLIYILEKMQKKNSNWTRADIKKETENLTRLNVGIDPLISFAKNRHQALNVVYFTTVNRGKLRPIKSWKKWKK